MVTLSELADAVCQCTGISREQLKEHTKKNLYNLARGVFFMLSREYGIHPNDTSAFVGRSRTSCITTAKQYRGYYETGDREVCKIVQMVKKMTNG